MVTHNPLHRSGRAGFPHPALADQPPHAVPGNAAILAAPRQGVMPEPADLKPEHVQRGEICPGRVLLGRIPFGQTPSLHPLHRRRTSLDFPKRPGTTAFPGEHGTSRFPRKVHPCVHGISGRAGLRCASRYRRAGCCLPLSPTASASRRKVVTRLNTRPARSPVHASALPLRTAPQDSGSLWVANPSTYDSFIHYTLPVLTGAQETIHA
jgi:hypothetical protein